MKSKYVFLVMVAVTVLLVAGTGAAVYFANTLLQKQSNKLLTLKLEKASLDQQQADLKKARKDVFTYQPLSQVAKAIVPQDKDQAEGVREIVNLASASGFTLSSITFQPSTLGQKAVAASGSTEGGSTPAPKPSSALTQVTPLKGIPGVYDLGITITQADDHPIAYTKFINFLDKLEKNRRTAQVTGIQLKPSSLDPSQLSFTLTVDEFIKP
jgi:hypothetical protein